MEQVFRSILENALAACPDPVRAEVRCEAATGPAGSRLRIAIRDNGPGLTAKQKPRIFDPFYTTKTRHTGLGIALAGRIVEVHGGVSALAMTTMVPARRSSLSFRPRSRNVRAGVT